MIEQAQNQGKSGPFGAGVMYARAHIVGKVNYPASTEKRKSRYHTEGTERTTTATDTKCARASNKGVFSFSPPLCEYKVCSLVVCVANEPINPLYFLPRCTVCYVLLLVVTRCGGCYRTRSANERLETLLPALF